jgi:hypothetical protein
VVGRNINDGNRNGLFGRAQVDVQGIQVGNVMRPGGREYRLQTATAGRTGDAGGREGDGLAPDGHDRRHEPTADGGCCSGIETGTVSRTLAPTRRSRGSLLAQETDRRREVG